MNDCYFLEFVNNISNVFFLFVCVQSGVRKIMFSALKKGPMATSSSLSTDEFILRRCFCEGLIF